MRAADVDLTSVAEAPGVPSLPPMPLAVGCLDAGVGRLALSGMSRLAAGRGRVSAP